MTANSAAGTVDRPHSLLAELQTMTSLPTTATHPVRSATVGCASVLSRDRY
jgi:hypothetical protein